MATNKNTRNTRNTEKREAPQFKRVDHTFRVRNAFEFDDGNVSFILDIDDITIYGCRLVEGRKGTFVAMPQKKGKNGEFYAHVFYNFSEEDTGEIVNAVYEQLER